MISRTNLSHLYKWLFILSSIVLLNLFASNVQAQSALINDLEPVGRDSTIKPPKLSRAEFLALSYSDQMDFLNNPPFEITDLVNASAADLFNPSPDLVFVVKSKFYDQSLTPPAL